MKKILLLAMALCALPCLGQTALTCTNSVTIGGQAQQGPAFYSIQLTSGDACALNFTPPGSGNVAQQITLKIYQSASAPYTGSVTTGTGLTWQGSAPTVPGTASALVIANCLLDNTGAVCSVPGGGGDTITAPQGTLAIGGSSSATTADLNYIHDGVEYSYLRTGDRLTAINACIQDAVTGVAPSHICDLRGEAATQTFTGGIVGGNTTGTGTIYFPASCAWSFNLSGGTGYALTQYTQTAIIADANAAFVTTTSGKANCNLINASAANGAAGMYTTVGTGYIRLEGVGFRDSGVALASGMNFQLKGSALGQIQDNSIVRLVSVYTQSSSNVGMFIGGTTAGSYGGCCALKIELSATNSAYTGGVPLVIEQPVGGGSNLGIDFEDFSATHPTSSEPIIECINNSLGVVESDIKFSGVLYEETYDGVSTATGVNTISKCGNISVATNVVQALGAPANTTTTPIWTIASGTPNAPTTFGVDAISAVNFNSTSTYGVVNSASGISVAVDANGNLRHYGSNTSYYDAINAGSMIDSGLGSSTNPICPNGTNGALTTSGCSASVSTVPYYSTNYSSAVNPTLSAANTAYAWSFLVPTSVTATKLTYFVSTGDNTANLYNIGIYNASGTLLAQCGATAGTTFSPSSNSIHTCTFSSTAFPAGGYIAVYTGNATTAVLYGALATLSPFPAASSVGTTSGAVLPGTITPPAASWGSAYGMYLSLHN